MSAGSRLASLVGGRLDVHCHHHQAVRSHPGFEPVAWAGDGTLEAMESAGDRFCLAVQWHPEMTPADPCQQGLFEAFVAEAAARRTEVSVHGA